MSGNPITLRDIAVKSGVSIATVSRALNGDLRCKASTRHKVLVVADALGYHPDPGVAALARRRNRGRANQYPLIWLCEHNGELESYEKCLFSAVKLEAERRGYQLSLGRIPRAGGSAAAGRVFRARGVLGCFVPTLLYHDTVANFAWEDFSVVSFLQENYNLNFDSVRPDMFDLMFKAWRRGKEAGFSRIGAVIPSSHIALENDLLLSACAYHQHEIEAENRVPPLILQPKGGHDREHYTGQIRNWFCTHQPDLVIGKTEGSYWKIRKFGYGTPHDFQFIALRKTDSGNLIAGFEWRTNTLAESLMERMHALVSLGQRGSRECPGSWVVDGRWHDGKSFLH